jgi:Uma2 family endonuclease
MNYDRGNVELMSPYIFHGRIKKLFGYMIEALTDELDMPRVAAGSTTFNSEILDRGLEPDECYYLANAHRLRDVKQVDMTIDPPPDLAIEIEITTSLLDKLGIYAALGIPEIWKHDGEQLSVLLLQPDGAYAPSESSAAFPFLPMGEVARFLREYEPTNDTRWGRAFRAWVRDEVVPRVRGEADHENAP